MFRLGSFKNLYSADFFSRSKKTSYDQVRKYGGPANRNVQKSFTNSWISCCTTHVNMALTYFEFVFFSSEIARLNSSCVHLRASARPARSILFSSNDARKVSGEWCEKRRDRPISTQKHRYCIYVVRKRTF